MTHLKITTTRENLLAATQFAAGVIPKRPPLPVLAGLLLEAGDMFTVSAFDYEITASETVHAATVHAPGRVLVDGKQLPRMVKTLDKGAEVVLTADDTRLFVDSGVTRFELGLLNVDDYPPLPAGQGEPLLTLPAVRLAELAPKLARSASRDTAAPSVLGTVAIRTGDGRASMATTDRYRMTHVRLARDGATTITDTETTLLATATTVEWAAKALKTAGDQVTVSVGTQDVYDRVITFTAGGRAITTRTMDTERSIDHESFFPADKPSTAIEVDGPALTKAVNRVATVVERNRPVTVELSDGMLTITGATADEAAASETVPAGVIGGQMGPLGYRPEYLVDAITTLGRRVWMYPTSQTKPTVLIGDDPAVRMVLMPIKLNS